MNRPTSKFGAPKRTAADRERDLVMFCTTARIEAVRATTPEELAARYGCSLKAAKYRHALRLGDWS